MAQKEEIARWCTMVYHEEFHLARYLIQVIFYEIARGDQYIAGEPARPTWYGFDAMFEPGGMRNRKPGSFTGSGKALPRPLTSLKRQSGSIFVTFPR